MILDHHLNTYLYLPINALHCFSFDFPLISMIRPFLSLSNLTYFPEFSFTLGIWLCVTVPGEPVNEPESQPHLNFPSLLLALVEQRMVLRISKMLIDHMDLSIWYRTESYSLRPKGPLVSQQALNPWTDRSYSQKVLTEDAERFWQQRDLGELGEASLFFTNCMKTSAYFANYYSCVSVYCQDFSKYGSVLFFYSRSLFHL